jgi:hypothetical protein
MGMSMHEPLTSDSGSLAVTDVLTPLTDILRLVPRQMSASRPQSGRTPRCLPEVLCIHRGNDAIYMRCTPGSSMRCTCDVPLDPACDVHAMYPWIQHAMYMRCTPGSNMRMPLKTHTSPLNHGTHTGLTFLESSGIFHHQHYLAIMDNHRESQGNSAVR